MLSISSFCDSFLAILCIPCIYRVKNFNKIFIINNNNNNNNNDNPLIKERFFTRDYIDMAAKGSVFIFGLQYIRSLVVSMQ